MDAKHLRGRPVAADRINPVLSPDIAQPAGHYPHAIICNGFVFVSGQLPVPREGGHQVGLPFEEQCMRVLDSLAAILLASGSRIERLVKSYSLSERSRFVAFLQRGLR